MKQTIYILIVLAILLTVVAAPIQAVDPVVTNITAAQQVGSTTVDIYYDLYDADSATTMVMVTVSTNNGDSFDVPVSRFSGDGYGYGVKPSTNLHIIWEAGVDVPGIYMPQVQVQVTASDIPFGMVLIPAGFFYMGDNLDYTNYYPVHSVYISSFYMDKFEVTKEKWDEVYNWAIGNGYSFDNTGSVKTVNNPVHNIDWYDTVKWCNARSEKEGRTPCYYTSADKTIILQRLHSDISNDCVKWDADGYRLPTEAEWEKAARGGASGHRFPWTDTDTITHDRANYFSTNIYSYDVSPTRGYHPDYKYGDKPYTSPVGSFAPNGYGLYDMAGNLLEWCWDRYDFNYYTNSPGIDPRGPESGDFRVVRDGKSAHRVRCASRIYNSPYIIDFNPDYSSFYYSFRSVCKAEQ